MHNPSFYFITKKGIVIILKFYTVDINYIKYQYSFYKEVYFNVVDLRKAIPVAEGCYHEIDIRHHKDRDLLAKEYEFCKRKKNTIFNKTLSIIRHQKKTKEIKFGYCNYDLLEDKMKNWDTQH